MKGRQGPISLWVCKTLETGSLTKGKWQSYFPSAFANSKGLQYFHPDCRERDDKRQKSLGMEVALQWGVNDISVDLELATLRSRSSNMWKMLKYIIKSYGRSSK